MTLTPNPKKPTVASLRQPLTMAEIAHIADNMDAFRSCCDWITNYLAQPHPSLGRTGSVCPFAAPAISKDTLRVAVVRFNDGADKKSQVMAAVMQYRDAFLRLGNSDETRMLHAVLILFPDVQADEAAALIDTTKEELKSVFVEQGLMLGEFHANNKSPGLHNPAFTPLQSAIPMLAIRRMVTTDYVFLNRSDYDLATRLRYIETYLNVSGIADSNIRKELEAMAVSLKTQLASLSTPRL